jgi:hypothetical protein
MDLGWALELPFPEESHDIRQNFVRDIWHLFEEIHQIEGYECSVSDEGCHLQSAVDSDVSCSEFDKATVGCDTIPSQPQAFGSKRVHHSVDTAATGHALDIGSVGAVTGEEDVVLE